MVPAAGKLPTGRYLAPANGPDCIETSQGAGDCGIRTLVANAPRLVRFDLSMVKRVKIHGEWVPVAARIERIDSMSAHADSNELLRWLHGFRRPPQQTFIVHGEPVAQDALGARIQAELGWAHKAPEHRETVQF